MTLTGRTAIITGAGRGIGRAVAIELAREGASVVVAAKTESELIETASQITSAGYEALALPADVSSLDGIERLMKTAEDWKGQPDILVNNAGIRGPVGFIQNIEPEEFERVFAVNVFGTFMGIRAALPGMVHRQWGRIINFSGGGAWNGIRGGGPYAASKSAIEGMSRTIAIEVQRFNVTCNVIQPGRVDTATFPILEAERGGSQVGPEHTARCIAWLCTEEANDVTGTTINAVRWDTDRESEGSRQAVETAGTKGLA